MVNCWYVKKGRLRYKGMVSESDEEYAADSINDLRPVCPNCHMVLHSKKDGCCTIEEIKEMLAPGG